VSEQEGAP